MSDKPFVEKRCTCGKISWDSETGSYKEKHEVPDGYFVRDVWCDTNGGTIVDGVEQG